MADIPGASSIDTAKPKSAAEETREHLKAIETRLAELKEKGFQRDANEQFDMKRLEAEGRDLVTTPAGRLAALQNLPARSALEQFEMNQLAIEIRDQGTATPDAAATTNGITLGPVAPSNTPSGPSAAPDTTPSVSPTPAAITLPPPAPVPDAQTPPTPPEMSEETKKLYLGSLAGRKELDLLPTEAPKEYINDRYGSPELAGLHADRYYIQMDHDRAQVAYDENPNPETQSLLSEMKGHLARNGIAIKTEEARLIAAGIVPDKVAADRTKAIAEEASTYGLRPETTEETVPGTTIETAAEGNTDDADVQEALEDIEEIRNQIQENRRARLRAMRLRTAEGRAELRRLREEATGLKQDLATAQERLKQAQEIARLRTDWEATNAQIEKALKLPKNAAQAAQLDALEEKLAKIEEQLDAFEVQADAEEPQFEQTTTRSAESQDKPTDTPRLRELRMQLRNAEDELALLQRTVDSRERSRVLATQQTVERLQQEIRTEERNGPARAVRIAELEEQIAARKQLVGQAVNDGASNEQVANLLAPMRDAERRLRNLRNGRAEDSTENPDGTPRAEGPESPEMARARAALQAQNAGLDQRAQNLPGRAWEWVKNVADDYRKMPLGYKVGLGLGFSALAGATTAIGAPLAFLGLTGLAGQQALSKVGTYFFLEGLANSTLSKLHGGADNVPTWQKYAGVAAGIGGTILIGEVAGKVMHNLFSSVGDWFGTTHFAPVEGARSMYQQLFVDPGQHAHAAEHAAGGLGGHAAGAAAGAHAAEAGAAAAGTPAVEAPGAAAAGAVPGGAPHPTPGGPELGGDSGLPVEKGIPDTAKLPGASGIPAIPKPELGGDSGIDTDKLYKYPSDGLPGAQGGAGELRGDSGLPLGAGAQQAAESVPHVRDLAWNYKALEDAALKKGQTPAFLYGLMNNNQPIANYAQYVANLPAGTDVSHDVKNSVAAWLNAHADLLKSPGTTVAEVARQVMQNIRK